MYRMINPIMFLNFTIMFSRKSKSKFFMYIPSFLAFYVRESKFCESLGRKNHL